MIFAVLGWVALAGVGVLGYVLYQKATAPGVADLRAQRIVQQYGTAASDPTANQCLPLPGQADRRSAREVFGCWGVAVGCIPEGEHQMHGRWDVDIGGWEHGRDTIQVGESGLVGGHWVPALGAILPRIERKMLDEVGSGFPAQPPNENDQSERSLRMDMRSCLWRAIKRQLGQPENFGFGDWRLAMRYRGSRSRQQALQNVMQPVSSFRDYRVAA